ncbi:patatin-like phospholipase family protein [Tunturiibacter gelidoferens]|uniref:NTE family protein n=1 Tax=Tunturiibacter gelidiferens TaxID=3069689 RepID=A0A9X0U2F1_9BACT|nr:patatin-like phospholipase family protein [Edaphobacter lichenicola]MBB5327218.1 NTE family protein [Edaphobacter lichenicola]
MLEEIGMSLQRRASCTLLLCLTFLLMSSVARSQTPQHESSSTPTTATPAPPAPTLQSRDTNTTKRPRIALVLEGGGALGFAHIGVIDYLEQHHIPVDLVVGTSMGGLVGGLYASGRSPDEIRTLLHDIDWDVAIGGRTPFRDLSYRRKQDREDFPNRLDFGLKHGLSFPEGLNSGQEVGLILDRATLPDYALTSFNDLPISFRCVATNMNTGRAFVFDHGSLGQAMRATMSIPGVFVPVVIDGQTFTDGGSVDNLPVDVARANGADIVIASYLDTGQTTTQRAGSFLSVTSNTISIMIAANELHSLENADVLIRSDLKGFTSSMFSDSAIIAPKGMEAARQKAALLERFSIPDAEWAEYVKQRDSRRKTTVPNPQFLAVTGADPNTNAEIDRRLKPEVVDKPIDPKFLDLEMTRFVGNGTLNAAGYSMVQRDGVPGLAVTAYPKSYGPPFLDLGITIDGSDTQDVLFGMSGRVTFTNLGGYRAEWRNDAFFGYSYGLKSEYYKPFSAKSRFFYAPRAYVTSTRFDFYNEGSRTSQYQINQNGFGFDGGYTWPRGAELRIGQDEYWYSVNKRIDFDNLSIPAQQQSVSSLRFNSLGADNAVLPFNGLNTFFRVERHQPSKGNDPFTLAEGRVAAYFPISAKNSVFVIASGGTSFGAPPDVTDLQGFPLGGPFRLGSYGKNELLGNQFYLFQAGYERKLFKFNPLFGEGLYIVGFMEGGKVYENLNAADSLISQAWDGSVAIVARTAIGPMYIGGAAGDNDHRKWWFGLGRVF